MKNIKDFYSFIKLEEKWGDMHDAPTPNIEPLDYKVGDLYYYTSSEYSDSQYKPDTNPTFKIIEIKNGRVEAISDDNRHMDNPSTSELNSHIESGEVRLKR